MHLFLRLCLCVCVGMHTCVCVCVGWVNASTFQDFLSTVIGLDVVQCFHYHDSLKTASNSEADGPSRYYSTRLYMVRDEPVHCIELFCTSSPLSHIRQVCQTVCILQDVVQPQSQSEELSHWSQCILYKCQPLLCTTAGFLLLTAGKGFCQVIQGLTLSGTLFRTLVHRFLKPMPQTYHVAGKHCRVGKFLKLSF